MEREKGGREKRKRKRSINNIPTKKTRTLDYKRDDIIDFGLIFKKLDDLNVEKDPLLKLNMLKNVCQIIDETKKDIKPVPPKPLYKPKLPLQQQQQPPIIIPPLKLFQLNISISDLRKEYKKIVVNRSKGERTLINVHRKDDFNSSEILRVMTFNIQNMNSRDRLDPLMMSTMMCDIICLQEVAYLDESYFNTFINKMKDNEFDYIIEDNTVKKSQLLCTFYNKNKIELMDYEFKRIRSNSILRTRFNRIGEDIKFNVYNVYFDHNQNEIESKAESLKYIQLDSKPYLICGDFNSVRKSDYSNKKQWEWIVKNRINRNVMDPESHIFAELTTDYKSCISETTEYIKGDLLFTSWSMRVIDHIFINSDKWKIKTTNIRYPTFIYRGEKRTLSDHLPIITDLIIPSNNASNFNECIDELSKNKTHKDIIVKKGSILYHGTDTLIPDNMLYDNSFLSNRLRFPSHWAIKKSNQPHLNAKTPIIYKYSVKKDLKLILLDKNPSYICLNGKCVGEGSNKKGLSCENSFQCTEQPNHEGFGHLFYKKCSEGLTFFSHDSVLSQDDFLTLICAYTDYDGFKWTQHEHEFALCNPNKVLKFEGISYKKMNAIPEDRSQDISMLLDADENPINEVFKTYYSNWSKQ
jgi:endonuclease/exonuclease/phosphatase family metal-dependent hydrolase